MVSLLKTWGINSRQEGNGQSEANTLREPDAITAQSIDLSPKNFSRHDKATHLVERTEGKGGCQSGGHRISPSEYVKYQLIYLNSHLEDLPCVLLL